MRGIAVLLAGDIQQTLPVGFRGTRVDKVKECLKLALFWASVKIIIIISSKIC